MVELQFHSGFTGAKPKLRQLGTVILAAVLNLDCGGHRELVRCCSDNTRGHSCSVFHWSSVPLAQLHKQVIHPCLSLNVFPEYNSKQGSVALYFRAGRNGGTGSVGDTQSCPRAPERVRLLVAAACRQQEAPLGLPHSEARSGSRNLVGFPGVHCTRSHPRQLPVSAKAPAPGPGPAEPPRVGAPRPPL